MNIIRLPVTLFRCISISKKIAGQETYYPELKRKHRLIRIMDNIRWKFKYKETNEFYNSYGMDVKGVNPFNSKYIDNRSFIESRNKLNSQQTYSQNTLLRDKLLFFRYMREVDIPVPAIFAVIFDGEFFDLNFQLIDIKNFKLKENYFIKDINGQCASCVVWIKNFEEYKRKKEMFIRGRFIVQESLMQCSEMNLLNSYSINTMRLITIRDKCNNIKLFSGGLRIGTLQSGIVDNTSKGGIFVGIKADGCLNKYGFYKSNYGTKTHMHPDTRIEFEGFKIPYYNKAVEMVINAHRFFYDLHSIGWDIAITEKGCVIIEGNDNWEISSIQACIGGAKAKWLNAIQE